MSNDKLRELAMSLSNASGNNDALRAIVDVLEQNDVTCEGGEVNLDVAELSIKACCELLKIVKKYKLSANER